MPETKSLLVDLHITSLRPEGHFLERATSMASLLKEICNNHISLYCSLSEPGNLDKHIFDEIISQPGFNSFGFATLATNSANFLEDQTWLHLAEDYTCRTHLSPFNILGFCAQKHIEDGCSGLGLSLLRDNDLVNYLIGNLHKLYCAAPKEITLLCKLIAILYRPQLLSPSTLISTLNAERAIRTLESLRAKDSREQSGLPRAAAARIISTEISKGYQNVIFLTASIQDAIGALSAAARLALTAKAQHNRIAPRTTISFVFHQPTDFNDRLGCYTLKRLIHELNNSNLSLQAQLYTSSEEFKVHLSDPIYCNIGEICKVLCGPFPPISKVQPEPDTRKGHSGLRALLQANRMVQRALSDKSRWNTSTASTAERVFRPLPGGTIRKPTLNCYQSNSMRSMSIARLRKSADRLLFSFLGDIRDEKNFANYLNLGRNLKDDFSRIDLCRPSFFSTGGIEKSRKALDFHLRQSSSQSDTVYDLLDETDYFWLLQNSSCVFAAYDRHAYSVKQSGIFYESLLAGTPSILEIGTSSSHALGRLSYSILLEGDGSHEEFQDCQLENKECSSLDQLLRLDQYNSCGFAVSVSISPKSYSVLNRRVHAFLEVEVTIEPSPEFLNTPVSKKLIDFRGVPAACVYSSKEITWLSAPKAPEYIKIRARPLIGVNANDLQVRIVVLPKSVSDDVDFLARHAVVDLQSSPEDTLSRLRPFSNVWWPRMSRECSPMTASANKARQAIGSDLCLLMNK